MIESVANTTLPVEDAHASLSTQENRLRRVCGEFESLLVHYILKSGRKTLPGNDLFDKSHDSEIYKSMMDERLAISVSEAKGIGIGDLLYRQLAANQETSGAVKCLSQSF